jgi:hypothetical protein
MFINIIITIMEVSMALFFIQNTTFLRLDSVSVFSLNLLSWAQ